MAAEKSPAFQFYPKDFLTDEKVVAMSLETRGAYITLLCLCWVEGSIPDDVRLLARLAVAPLPQMRRVWAACRGCFLPHPEIPGRLVHKRLDQERRKQDLFRRRASQGGVAKHAASSPQAVLPSSQQAVLPSTPKQAISSACPTPVSTGLLSSISDLQSKRGSC